MLGYQEVLTILETEAKRLSQESSRALDDGNVAKARWLTSLSVGTWHAYYQITDATKRRHVLGR